MKIFFFKIPHATDIHLSLLAGLTLLAFNVHSRMEIISAITVSEFFIDNKTATLDETGQATEISPGITANYTQARINLKLDYRLNAVISSGLERDDHENQSLLFLTQITHQPNYWNTVVNARIKQTNVSPDGIQVINEINDSTNSQELRTVGISTSYQNRFGRDVDYLTSLSIDYADIENQDNTDSIGLNFGINNKRNPGKLSWNLTINSRRSGAADGDEQNDDQIDTLQAGLNYRINQKISSFLAVDKSETNNDDLKETNTIAGLFWAPNVNSSVKIGAGVRGDDTTWLLDSVLKNRRLSLSMNYEERVTTERQLVFEETEFEPGLVTTSQSLSITPVLLKKGTVSLTATGRRTEFTLAYFNQSNNLKNTNSEEEQTKGLSLSAKRTLSRLSSVQLSISSQESQTAQKNTINNFGLSYNRQLSRYISWSAKIRKTEQTSDVQDNEYEQSLIGFSLSATF